MPWQITVWDRGTMNARDLLVKFSSYAYDIASRQWASECSMPPALICIAPDIAQERRIMRVAQVKLKHIPELMLWTTTEVLLNEYGPIAQVWLQHTQKGSQEGQPGGLLRRMLFDTVPEHLST
jgi:hypothetical protein